MVDLLWIGLLWIRCTTNRNKWSLRLRQCTASAYTNKFATINIILVAVLSTLVALSMFLLFAFCSQKLLAGVSVLVEIIVFYFQVFTKCCLASWTQDCTNSSDVSHIAQHKRNTRLWLIAKAPLHIKNHTSVLIFEGSSCSCGSRLPDIRRQWSVLDRLANVEHGDFLAAVPVPPLQSWCY